MGSAGHAAIGPKFGPPERWLFMLRVSAHGEAVGNVNRVAFACKASDRRGPSLSGRSLPCHSGLAFFPFSSLFRLCGGRGAPTH